MAFDDGIGIDSSQPVPEDYVLSATGLVSKTLGLWAHRFVKYIVLVGVLTVFTTLMSFAILLTMFQTIGVLSSDPILYFFSTFALEAPSDWTLFTVTITFGIIAFIIGAIVSGAGIKFALDDYSGHLTDIRECFSRSISRIAQIVIVQLVSTFIVAAAVGPSLAMMTRAMEGIDISDPLNPIIDPEAIQYMLMGSLFLIVGSIFMLYITVRLAPALAVVLDTDLSALDSLKRAWALTGGNFWHVLGGQLLIGIIVAFIGGAVSGFTYLVLVNNPYGSVLDVVVTSLLFSAPAMVFIAVLYRDLASRKGESGSDLPEYIL